MDYSWTEEQAASWSDTVEFAQNQLTFDLVERDASETFIEANWQAIAQRGILGLYLPEQYGGQGRDMVTTIRTLEALGYGCPDNGLTLAVNGQMWAVEEPIYRFGTEEQKAHYLPRLINGTYKGAHGMTEPEAGSDAFSLQTTAQKVEGGYLLNGEKIYIGLAPNAEVILTFATVNPERGRWGLTAFIVDGDSEGISRESHSKMGLRTAPFGSIIYRDVFVPDSALLGREGAGASIFNASMDYERSFIFASHVGSMARQLDEVIQYATAREQGGQPISQYQAVSHRIAQMKIRLETARMFLYRCASLMDQGKPMALDAAMAKVAISELFVENSLDAIRIHGGRGYLTQYGIERDLRDAIGGVLYSGTSDIQKNLIAGLLGL